MEKGTRFTITIEDGLATVSAQGAESERFNLQNPTEAQLFQDRTDFSGSGIASLILLRRENPGHPVLSILADALIDVSSSTGINDISMVPGLFLRALARTPEKIEFSI